MRSKLELEIDICFKERELLQCVTDIQLQERKLEHMRVEYSKLEAELNELRSTPETEIRS